MDNEKLVSVIMPTYNGSEYIDKSLEAIIKQTYKKIEVIEVNRLIDAIVKCCQVKSK